jgi:hypothetical protein
MRVPGLGESVGLTIRIGPFHPLPVQDFDQTGIKQTAGEISHGRLGRFPPESRFEHRIANERFTDAGKLDKLMPQVLTQRLRCETTLADDRIGRPFGNGGNQVM